MQERRRYARLNIPLEVRYAFQGKEDVRHKTVTKNISPNGARFTIKEELSKGAVLELTVKIPTKSKPIPIKAKVAWSRKETGQGKDTYDAGFEFIEISEEDKGAFFQYLCNFMYDQIKKV